jgi:hypothetical protein
LPPWNGLLTAATARSCWLAKVAPACKTACILGTPIHILDRVDAPGFFKPFEKIARGDRDHAILIRLQDDVGTGQQAIIFRDEDGAFMRRQHESVADRLYCGTFTEIAGRSQIRFKRGQII